MASVATLRPHKQQEQTASLGMVVFLASWAMMFAGLFFAYGFIRSRAISWPPAGSPALPIALPAINTVVLVCSSLTFAHGLAVLRKGQRAAYMRALVVTIALELCPPLCTRLRESRAAQAAAREVPDQRIEREVRRLDVAAAAQRPDTKSLAERAAPQLGEQAALADPGRALHQAGARPPARRLPHALQQPLELALAPHEGGARRGPGVRIVSGHRRPVRPRILPWRLRRGRPHAHSSGSGCLPPAMRSTSPPSPSSTA